MCAGVAGQAGVEAPVPGHPGQLLPPQLGVAEQCGALIDVLTAPLQSAAWKKRLVLTGFSMEGHLMKCDVISTDVKC